MGGLRARLAGSLVALALLAAPATGRAAPAATGDSSACLAPAPFTDAPAGDNTTDAAGTGQLFERITVPGISDRTFLPGSGTGAIAVVDLNRDGLDDLVVQQDKTATGQPTTTQSDLTKLYLNDGCWHFTPHALTFANAPATSPGNASTPTFADFNGDGYLDFYLTRNRTQNSLFLSQGSFDSFDDVANDPAYATGFASLKNAGSYSRQASIADVDGDGHLDIAVGSDQIANRQNIGRPYQRLYVYDPPPAGQPFTAGAFADRAGPVSDPGTPGSGGAGLDRQTAVDYNASSGLVPGFGGSGPALTTPPFSATFPGGCNTNVDRASPSIALRDLDGDGDPDLLQSYHADMNVTAPPPAPFTFDSIAKATCSVGNWGLGTYAWENRIATSGAFTQRLEGDGNGLVEHGSQTYAGTAPDGSWQVGQEGPSVSLPYVNTADVNNDGHLDVIATGDTSKVTHVNADQTAAKLWLGRGGFSFQAATDAAGLGPLNWTYRQWESFWQDDSIPAVPQIQALSCPLSLQRPTCESLDVRDATQYGADTVFLDANNDGWQDMLFVDRRELDGAWGALRNTLFLNTGHGTFEPTTTQVSGMDANSIAAEAGDLNADGLTDLVLVADPENTYTLATPALPDDRRRNKIYLNTGTIDGVQVLANHAVGVRLTGRPGAELVGARIDLLDPASGAFLQRRDLNTNDSYKSSHELEVQFGLGARRAVDVRVRLRDGTQRTFSDVPIDALDALDVADGSAAVLRPWRTGLLETPGAPQVTHGETPSATGAFTLSWTGADPASRPILYTLQHRDSDDADWSDVATGLTSRSYTFPAGAPEGEGTWRYRVLGVADADRTAWSSSSPAVVVDRGAPRSPTITTDRAPEDADGGWYRDTVTATFAAAGDPELADASSGSGVDPASVPEPVTVATTTTRTVSGTLRDRAGNSSAPATATLRVDASDPSLQISCPDSAVLGAAVTASISASDGGSGLQVDPSGTAPVDTSAVGPSLTTRTARDRVGHQVTVSCTTAVRYDYSGLLGVPDADGTSVVRRGVPLLLSFRVRDADGRARRAGEALLDVAGVSGGHVGEYRPATSPFGVQDANRFAFSPALRLHTYLLATAPLARGRWSLRVSLDDGTTHETQLTIR